MPAPDPRVHIEQLVAAGPRVALELDLHKSTEAHRLEQAFGEAFQLGEVQGLHERARAPKLDRPLPRTTRHERGHRPARRAHGRVRELNGAAPGNELLNDDERWIHER